MKRVITISRQTGSGGREIAKKLAERLGIPYYDKELLKRAARDSGLCEQIVESFDEKPRSLLYSLVMDPYSYTAIDGLTGTFGTVEQNVYTAVFETIRRVANESPCVIIGRCADYALKDVIPSLSVFISADPDFRKKRLAEENGITPEKAASLMEKTDKKRASYYNYYSDGRWGDAANYDLCINSSVLGIDKTVDMIIEALNRI